MGSGFSKKSKSKVDNKAKTKKNQLDSSKSRQLSCTLCVKESKEELTSEMDVEGEVRNNIENSSKKLEAESHSHEVCNQVKNAEDDMDHAEETKSKVVCDDTNLPENRARIDDMEITKNEKINEKEDNSSFDTKTGHENRSENCQSVETLRELTSSTETEVIDATTVDTFEHSHYTNNIVETSFDVTTVSSNSNEKSSNAGEEKSAVLMNNDNVNNSGDEVTVKPTAEKDKEACASTTIGEHEADNTWEYGLSENLRFYRNELYSKPFPGAKIDEMLKWKGDYQRLERTHSYIQWLFPIPESRGMNYSAQPLQEHEAQAITEDETLKKRVLDAFEMMLDFYGMELDLDTETIKRGNNWEERYEHLNRSVHNHFRITRIIKSLGELGWKQLQTVWLEFIIHEAKIKQVLPKLNDEVTMSHFIDALKEDEEKGRMYHFLADLSNPASTHNENVENDKRKVTANSSDSSDERNEENNVPKSKDGSSIKNISEESMKYVHNKTEEKLIEVNENQNPVIPEENLNVCDKSEKSDTNNAGDKANEMKENNCAINNSKASEITCSTNTRAIESSVPIETTDENSVKDVQEETDEKPYEVNRNQNTVVDKEDLNVHKYNNKREDSQKSIAREKFNEINENSSIIVESTASENKCNTNSPAADVESGSIENTGENSVNSDQDETTKKVNENQNLVIDKGDINVHKSSGKDEDKNNNDAEKVVSGINNNKSGFDETKANGSKSSTERLPADEGRELDEANENFSTEEIHEDPVRGRNDDERVVGDKNSILKDIKATKVCDGMKSVGSEVKKNINGKDPEQRNQTGGCNKYKEETETKQNATVKIKKVTKI